MISHDRASSTGHRIKHNSMKGADPHTWKWWFSYLWRCGSRGLRVCRSRMGRLQKCGDDFARSKVLLPLLVFVRFMMHRTSLGVIPEFKS